MTPISLPAARRFRAWLPSLTTVVALATAGPARLSAQPVEKAYFAGGCFWGIEAVFEHVKGVREAISGYAGGTVEAPTYEMVSSETTGHAETVEVTFDPTQVSYATLLDVFMHAHDPTQLNRQEPDEGTSYRSAIFFANADQERAARAVIAKLTAAKTYRDEIVTEVTPLSQFWRAERSHQNYLVHHLNQPYIVRYDLPKLAALKQRFPELYRDG